jgi:hypothetical protein
MYKNVHDYCKFCDACQKIGGLTTQSLANLVISFIEETFMKWGLNFVGPIKLAKKKKRKQIYFCNHKLCY